VQPFSQETGQRGELDPVEEAFVNRFQPVDPPSGSWADKPTARTRARRLASRVTETMSFHAPPPRKLRTTVESRKPATRTA